MIVPILCYCCLCNISNVSWICSKRQHSFHLNKLSPNYKLVFLLYLRLLSTRICTHIYEEMPRGRSQIEGIQLTHSYNSTCWGVLTKNWHLFLHFTRGQLQEHKGFDKPPICKSKSRFPCRNCHLLIHLLTFIFTNSQASPREHRITATNNTSTCGWWNKSWSKFRL